MKLNQNPNLRVEDFQSEQSWIGKLFAQLNPFIASVNQVFDSNIDFATNIKSVTRDYSITSFQSFSLQWPYKDAQPMDVRVIKASKGAQGTPCILFAAWSYDSTNSVITVTEMIEATKTGLGPVSGRYAFTIRANV
jgi:hypothetical protein